MGERPEGPGSMKTSVSWTHHMPLFSEFLTKETINALVVQATIQFSNTCSQMHSNQKDSNQRQEDPCVFLKHNLLYCLIPPCTFPHESENFLLCYLICHRILSVKYNRYSQNNYQMHELTHIFNFHRSQIHECQESIIRSTFLHPA